MHCCMMCTSVCGNGDLRLVDSERNGEGRVEICFNNTYGSICADFWDELDAQVVCGQLGFMRNGQTQFIITNFDDYMSFFFPTGSQPNVTTGENDTFLGSVHCTGNEPMLIDCSNSRGIQCSRAELAGVRCEGKPPYRYSSSTNVMLSTWKCCMVISC